MLDRNELYRSGSRRFVTEVETCHEMRSGATQFVGLYGEGHLDMVTLLGDRLEVKGRSFVHSDLLVERSPIVHTQYDVLNSLLNFFP